MSLVNKSTLHGAGDGIGVQKATPKRLQVSSARKFATRGIVKDRQVQEKLQEAMDKYFTPPESPMARRAITLTEITPSKRQQIKTKSSKANSTNECKKLKDGDGVKSGSSKGDNSQLQEEVKEKTRVLDAGRRVSHQLVVNAWRQRRTQVASLVESRDKLHSQVKQLQLQVDVLQKLREGESSRRTQALNENQQLRQRIDCLQSQNRDFLQQIQAGDKKEEALKTMVENVRQDVMNERNLNVTLRNQKENDEKEIQKEKKKVADLRDELKKMTLAIEEGRQEILKQKRNCKDYKDVLRMSEDKYSESVENNEELKRKLEKLEKMNDFLQKEKGEVEQLLSISRTRCDKMEAKMQDLKKLLLSARQMKKRTIEENEELKSRIGKIEDFVKADADRKWWLKAGEFVGYKLIDFAYLVFPALPKGSAKPLNYSHLDVLNGSIAFGDL